MALPITKLMNRILLRRPLRDTTDIQGHGADSFRRMFGCRGDGLRDARTPHAHPPRDRLGAGRVSFRLIGSTFVGIFDLRFNRNWSHLVTTNALFALIALAATSPSPIHRPPVSSRSVAVRVDEGRHTLTVTIGPFHVPQSPSMMGDMMMMRRNSDELEGAFTWPATVRFRGVTLEVIDSAGHPLP